MSKNSKPVLEVKNLVKKFSSGKGKEFTAVDGVSFSVAEGEILGFLGPNGAGKSTTINCLLGVIKPDAGEIKIFDKELSKNREEIMQNTNYCSAEYQMPWNLSVYEGLLVFCKLYLVTNARERIDELLELFNISGLKNKRIRELSLGERARVSIAKSLLNHPKLLFLDEPMASMDPDVVDRGIRLIKKIQKEEKISILYTSHNMWEIEQVADRVIFINHGKIMASGTPLELTRQELKLKAKEPNLRDVFIHLSRKTLKEDAGNEPI